MSSNPQCWEFDRYVKGRLMAEGIRITREKTLEAACQAASALADRGDVLVLRSPTETNCDGWIAVTDRLPESGVKVLGYWRNELGKSRRTCVEYVAPRTRTADGFWDDTPDDWFDVDESGTSWVPSDWYECVEGSDEYPYTPIPVERWHALPPSPEKTSGEPT